jgi:hypothetical protein
MTATSSVLSCIRLIKDNHYVKVCVRISMNLEVSVH